MLEDTQRNSSELDVDCRAPGTGNPLRRAWQDCSAAEIAEAAFVLPLLFMFILGIFQFGRVFLVYSTMQRAAEEGARAAAGFSCATCGVAPLTAAQVATNIVGPILQNAHVDATLLAVPTTPARNSCTGVPVTCDLLGTGATPKICVQRNVVLNLNAGNVATSGSPVCGTAVSMVYPYNFTLPSVSSTAPYVSQQTYALNLKAQAQVKGED
jgi:Flp pilus assembly protein TadG